MENKTFAETLYIVYLHNKFNPIAYLEHPKSLNLEEAIELFNRYNFLNKIPLEERESACLDILAWMKKYYRGKIYTRKTLTKDKPNKAIKPYITKLNNVETMLEEFLPKVKTQTNQNGTTFTDYSGMMAKDTKSLLAAYELIKKLKMDMETKTFNIFPKEFFYDSDTTTKEELGAILRSLVKKHNLKPSENIPILLKDLPDNN